MVRDAVARSLRHLGVQVADVHDPGRGAADRLGDAGHGGGRQDAGVEGSGTQHDLVRREDRLDGLGAGRGVRRLERHGTKVGPLPHGDLTPHHSTGVDPGVELDRRRGVGQHPTDATEDPSGLVERPHQITFGLLERHQQQVPERVALELTGAEPVLHRGDDRGVVVRQCHQALAQISGRGPRGRGPESTRRAPVVGDGHHCGDRPGVATGRAQRGREAVASAHRHHGRC